MNYRSIVISALFSAMISAPVAYAHDKGVTVNWGYTGAGAPDNWGNLDPAFQTCSSGIKQSPIDITGGTPSQTNKLEVLYGSAPLNIVKDGISVVHIGTQTIIFKDGHTIQLNFLPNGPKEILKVNGQEYRLAQFHLHTPSETHLNGTSFPLEIHFVNQNKYGKVAVIGVWVKAGANNPELENLINNLPKEKGKKYLPKNVNVNPNNLLPANKSYYSFDGSLTTPPCTEGLQWFVMAEPITASPDQIQKLEAAIGENNARPIQPLNGREITHVTVQ